MKLDDFAIAAYAPTLTRLPSIRPVDIAASTICCSPTDLQALDLVLDYMVAPVRSAEPNTFQFYTVPKFSSFATEFINQPDLRYLQINLLSTIGFLEIGFFQIILGHTFETIELNVFTSAGQQTEKIHIQDHQQIIAALQRLRFPYKI